jgi:hypothetical protein
VLTCNDRYSGAGERIAALAERTGDVTVATTGTVAWPGAVHVDELSGTFDAAIAGGWQACLHVFRPDAKTYAYYVPAMQDALLWHGDERRLLAALTYDLPLTLIAPSRALATSLEAHAPGRRLVVVEPGIARDGVASSSTAASEAGGRLRVASATPADEVLARASAPVEPAELDAADVLLELVPTDSPLVDSPRAMLAGVVPVVTPAAGHDELVTDGENAIVVEFDDVPGTARVLDTLARDRDLLARLAAAARARGERLPTLDDEAAALIAALDAAPPAWDRPQRLLLNARAVAEPIAQERRALDVALREYEQRIEQLSADNERLVAELEELRRRPLARLRRKLARALPRSAAPDG